MVYNPNATVAQTLLDFQARLLLLETPVIVPVIPSFTSLPSISNDGSPQVGEIASFDFGVILNGVYGNRRLRKDGVDYADASIGSIQWSDPGSYVLRVYVANTTIYADSPVVNVAAAAVSAINAPTLSDPDNFVSGANPPRQKVSIDQNTDKSTVKLVGQWDYSLSGAFAYDASRAFEIVSTDPNRPGLLPLFDAEEGIVSGYANLPAGPFRLRVRFVSLSDSNNFSSWSNFWTDTINGQALPAATTQFDANNKSVLVTLTETTTGNGDFRIFTGHPAANYPQPALVTLARSDSRYFEVKIVDRGNDDGPSSIWIGICPADTVVDPNGYTLPANAKFVKINYTSISAGSVLTIAAKPAKSDGTAGTFAVYLNGSPAQGTGDLEVPSSDHNLVNYKAFVATARNARLRFNAGQEVFTYTPPAPFIRYN